MAELHVFGQLVGGSNFALPNLFCKWSLEAGSNFRVLQGTGQGQTQCDHPNVPPPAALPRSPRGDHARSLALRRRPMKWQCGRIHSTCTTR